MTGRSRSRRRRRRRRAKVEAEAVPEVEVVRATDSSVKAFPSSGSYGTSTERTVLRKIPISKLSQSSPNEKEQEEGVVDASPRRTPDALDLRRRLLGLIRCYYLDAISRLPTTDLSSTLTRGLLIAGHCYGPLHPVHNILLNTIWYAAAFPLRPGNRIDVQVISDRSISRVVQRSLDGLVASLLHHCPWLSHEDALWHLNLCRADLRAAVPSARGDEPSLFCRPTESEVEAVIQVAAKAARHPKPATLAFFASSIMPSVECDAVSQLNNKRSLSSADILCLSAMLLPSPLSDKLDQLPYPPLRERCPKAFGIISRRRRNFIRWYAQLLEIADAALGKYAQQTAAQYELHTVYGAGSLRDEFDLEESVHINFMAWPKDPSCARDAPVFFFAEALCPSESVYREEDISLCCTVQPSPSEVDSCRTCLIENFRIDHPGDSEPFGGGQHYKMDEIGRCYRWPTTIDVDYRCFDPDRDIDLVEYLDQDFARFASFHNLHKYRNAGDKDIMYYCRRFI